MFGAYAMETERFYWKSAERGNTDSFLMFVHQLRAHSAGKHTILILDNASYHHSGRVRRFLERHDDVSIFYLPPYSPEYNPVEQIWNWLKGKVYQAQHGEVTVEGLISRVRRFIWHWREGRLVTELKVGIGIWQSLYT